MIPKFAGLMVVLILLTGSGVRAQSVIEGEIDAAKALKFLYGNYDSETGGSVTRDARVMKAFEDEGFVMEWATQEGIADGKRQWFLYTTVRPVHSENYTCHACEVEMGAAMFEKEDRGWVNKAQTAAMGMMGGFGAPPPMEPQPVQWGKNAFGLVVMSAYTGYGEITATDTLVACKVGQCGVIFSVRTSYTNGLSLAPASEMVSWEAEWSFAQPGPTGMFDVVVKMKTDDKLAHTTAARKRGQWSPTPGVFRYDGKAYRKVGSQIELGK